MFPDRLIQLFKNCWIGLGFFQALMSFEVIAGFQYKFNSNLAPMAMKHPLAL